MSEDIKSVTKTMLARLGDVGKPLTFATIKTNVKTHDDEIPVFRKEGAFREFLEGQGFAKPRLVRLMICNVYAGMGWWVHVKDVTAEDDTLKVRFSDHFNEEVLGTDSNLGRRIEPGEEFTIKFDQVWNVKP